MLTLEWALEWALELEARSPEDFPLRAGRFELYSAVKSKS